MQTTTWGCVQSSGDHSAPELSKLNFLLAARITVVASIRGQSIALALHQESLVPSPTDIYRHLPRGTGDRQESCDA